MDTRHPDPTPPSSSEALKLAAKWDTEHPDMAPNERRCLYVFHYRNASRQCALSDGHAGNHMPQLDENEYLTQQPYNRF